MAWRMPPHSTNEKGEERRCGVEIEYIDVPLPQAATLIAHIWNGSISWQHDHRATIHTESLGDFTVELDVEWMQKLSQQAREDRELGQFPLAETADKMLFPMVSAVAPNEIVTPPIPFSRLHELDKLVQELREAGGKGTSDSVIYAFGVHLNPETPALDAQTILHYLQSFVLLYDWMKHAMHVDATRSLTGFARGFPMEYARRILAPSYRPDMAQLIDDYLECNPTRNRALDMLPLLAHIDGDTVRAEVADTLVKSRPTFHFRLPNCLIDQPGWQLQEAWGYWLEVEKLAWNHTRREAMQQAFLRLHANPFHRLSDAWRKETKQWLNAPA